MWEKVIGGGVGFVAGRVIGGIGVAAMGGAIGIPAVAVTGICTVAGAAIGNSVWYVLCLNKATGRWRC